MVKKLEDLVMQIGLIDVIVHLPTTEDGSDEITTWVDRLTRRVHFLKSKTFDTGVKCTDAFLPYICRYHGRLFKIVSDIDCKFSLQFWKRLMRLHEVQFKMP